MATEGIEIRQIASIDTAAKTITLTKPLANAHAAGEYAGVEFVQYRWYPDVQLDNIFFHTTSTASTTGATASSAS